MLTITRHPGESLKVGDDVTIHISRIKSNQVAVSIDAPNDAAILRTELLSELERGEGDAALPMMAVEFGKVEVA